MTSFLLKLAVLLFNVGISNYPLICMKNWIRYSRVKGFTPTNYLVYGNRAEEHADERFLLYFTSLQKNLNHHCKVSEV